MPYSIRNGLIGNQPIADTSTDKLHPLGTIVTADDPTYGVGEFIYLLGVAGTVAGAWVTYNADDYTTALTVADALGPVAVAMSANVASGYGWYQISGKALAFSKSGIDDNAAVFLTSTSGKVASASVTGDLMFLAKSASAVTTSSTLAEFEIHRPFVRDGAAA